MTMTRLALTVGLLLFLALPAWAEDYPSNPDRRASLGVSLGLSGASGDATVTDSGVGSFPQNVSTGAADLTLDLRAPVSNNWTLSGAFSLTGYAQEADETVFLAGQEASASGFGLRVGARYYFGN